MSGPVMAVIDPADVGRTLVAAIERYPDAPLEIREGLFAALDDDELLRRSFEEALRIAVRLSDEGVAGTIRMYLDDLAHQ